MMLSIVANEELHRRQRWRHTWRVGGENQHICLDLKVSSTPAFVMCVHIQLFFEILKLLWVPRVHSASDASASFLIGYESVCLSSALIKPGWKEGGGSSHVENEKEINVSVIIGGGAIATAAASVEETRCEE